MRRKTQRSFEEVPEEESLLNLTPLIDVVFVVLITFMILAPMLEIESIDLAPAGPLSQKSPSNSSLAISIKSDNSLWLRGRSFTLQELEPLLRTEKKLYPQQIPQVAPEIRASFGTYQEVKNLLEACGFEQMEVLVK